MQTDRQGNSTTSTQEKYNTEISALKNARCFSELSEYDELWKKKKKNQRKKGKEKDLSLYPTINQYEMMKGEG